MEGSFDRATLDRLRSAEEVELEISAAPGGEAHRTIIWVVVDEHDRVLIRSVRGSLARWYREAVAHPACLLHLEGMAVAVSAVPATDDERVAACSRGYLTKYRGHGAMRSMITPATLPTTLELLPR
jgi:hypothetical protein